MTVSGRKQWRHLIAHDELDPATTILSARLWISSSPPTRRPMCRPQTEEPPGNGRLSLQTPTPESLSCFQVSVHAGSSGRCRSPPRGWCAPRAPDIPCPDLDRFRNGPRMLRWQCRSLASHGSVMSKTPTRGCGIPFSSKTSCMNVNLNDARMSESSLPLHFAPVAIIRRPSAAYVSCDATSCSGASELSNVPMNWRVPA